MTPINHTPLVIGQGANPLNDMKAIYTEKTTKKNRLVKIYKLICTEAEKAAYKKAKGTEYYKEDEEGYPLYYTQRNLSDEIEYKFVDGSLKSEDAGNAQAILNKLAKYDGISLEDLQKANQIKMLEAGV